jgi:hypothetical protein
LIGATWSSETSIIDSGWLFGALFAAQAAGPAAIAGWLIGGIAIVISALVHAELQSASCPCCSARAGRLFEDHVAGAPGVLEPVRVAESLGGGIQVRYRVMKRRQMTSGCSLEPSKPMEELE